MGAGDLRRRDFPPPARSINLGYGEGGERACLDAAISVIRDAVTERSLYYVLDDAHNPVPAPADIWYRFFANIDNRRVAVTKIGVGDVNVSTVFLGLDHSHSGEGPPILFETSVFGGPHDGDMARYATWDAAKAGYNRIVAELMAELTA